MEYKVPPEEGYYRGTKVEGHGSRKLELSLDIVKTEIRKGITDRQKGRVFRQLPRYLGILRRKGG